jgi:two-component system NtrC family sensor kinase
MSVPDENVQEYLAIIKSEIGNALRTISDLLDFFRIMPPRTAATPVHELIRQSLVGCPIPGNIQLHADLPQTLPKVSADPHQIGQVFRHLIINAVQAMPEGGELRIDAHRMRNSECGMRNEEKDSALDGDFIEISVADTGRGIAPEHMDKLFQPLFTTKGRGIGLGLPISKNITEANGGRMEAESRPGKGTIFRVVLPAAEESLDGQRSK